MAYIKWAQGCNGHRNDMIDRYGKYQIYTGSLRRFGANHVKFHTCLLSYLLLCTKYHHSGIMT